MNFNIIELNILINELKELSNYFSSIGIYDIYTNSKIYELLMAVQFNHRIANGHAYTHDAYDEFGNFYEYKHYKLSSSNHTWTFNDFSISTIIKLERLKSVCFAIINDEKIIPYVSKAYIVPGIVVSKYLLNKTPEIHNNRKMINISEHQIIENMGCEIICRDDNWSCAELRNVFITANKIEKLINVKGILTSNKLWELLVACKLGHKINPEQKSHDAYDDNEHTYEYKVRSNFTRNWIFQDISKNVLNSYLTDEKIVLAVVNKRDFVVEDIYLCNPAAIVYILEWKLEQKRKRFREIKRLSASICVRDIHAMLKYGDAEWVR